MQVIIDANVIFAMLIKPNKPVDLFFDHRLSIYAPQLLFEELENNKEEIIQKSKLTLDQFEWLYLILKHNINVIAEDEFLYCREQAENICPDEKDIVYFALALHLEAALWTNEKKLKEQKHIVVYATHELMSLLGSI